MADQEFLASFGVEIDETGLERLQAAMEKNRILAEDLALAFGRAQDAVTSFFQSLQEIPMPNLGFGATGLSGDGESNLMLPFSLDMNEANRELSAFMKEAGKTLSLTADASGVVSAGQGALNTLRSMFAASGLSIKASVQLSGISSDSLNGIKLGDLTTTTKAATGGRFSSPTKAEIAEDGDPEYVIPVKKESMAVPLLRQLIGELSDSAKETLRAATGGKESKQQSGASMILPERSDQISGSPKTIHQFSATQDHSELISGSPETNNQFPASKNHNSLISGSSESNNAFSSNSERSDNLPGSLDQLDSFLMKQERGDLRSGSPDPNTTQVPTGQESFNSLAALSDLLASASAAAAPVINQSTSNSVQAPVSINVTAAGSDPEAVGQSVYDIAEQYLLRTLQSGV